MPKLEGDSPRDDIELDDLLARGRLSGRQYDEIHERIRRQIRRERAPRLMPMLSLAAGTLLTITLVVVGIQSPPPSHAGRSQPFSDESPTSSTDLNPKGHVTPSGASVAEVPGVVDAGCGASAQRHCTLGDVLMFSVSGNGSPGYLIAYARRLDTPAAEPIWYFPAAGGAAPIVATNPGTVILPQGVRLGPPHTPGHYEIMAGLSPAPPTREGAADIATSRGVFEILSPD